MAKRQRRDRKREVFWRKALVRQRQSGLNVRQWCAGERLPESAFYFWRRTIAQRDQDAASAAVPVRQRPSQPMFVPVTVAMPQPEHPIVIRLRGGRVMRLPVGMDMRRVVELVHAIEDASALSEPALSLPAVSLSKPSNGSKGVAS